MTVSNVSAIASMASSMKSSEIALQLQAAVMKQMKDQQMQHAEDLLKMMEPSNAIVDGRVDVYV